MPRAWLDLASLKSDSRCSLHRPLASEDDLPFVSPRPRPSSDGVVFFGDSPYHFLAPLSNSSNVIDVSQLLSYTTVFVTQRFPDPSYKKDMQAKYYIKLRSIGVNNNSIPLNTSLLSIDHKGYGGTIFSTVCPYTELETSIYDSLTSAFIAEAAAMNIDRVPSVAPFSACFSSNSIQSKHDDGPWVPSIDLVFQDEGMVWTITGSNSMVPVNNNNVMCLGRICQEITSVYGFDCDRRVSDGEHSSGIRFGEFQGGFSSNLLGRRTSCANFNFTSIN